MIGSERLQVEYPVIRVTALGARLVFPSLQVMTFIQNEPHTRYPTTGTASNESVLVPGREMIARDTTNPLGNVPVQVNSLPESRGHVSGSPGAFHIFVLQEEMQTSSHDPCHPSWCMPACFTRSRGRRLSGDRYSSCPAF